MSLPVHILEQLTSQLKTAILHTQWIAGGDINQATRLQTASEIFFVKWNTAAPAGMFAAEAIGLQHLAASQTVRVPQVITVGDDFLVLEWLEPRSPQNPDRFAERLGEGLAALHQQTTAQHGLEADNFIGTLPQKNTPHADWAGFYVAQRIGVQQALAQQNRRLSPERANLLNRLREKLPTLVPAVTPALLHGDLWSGNYFCWGDDIPVIYDPAVYYGHREIDLAMTELFGGFPRRFYQAYQAVYPLETGYAERKALYQLYPLLVHLNLFGGGYGNQVEVVLRQYL